jgi:DNA-binding transcriptional regulator of glucitol operon
MSLIVLVLIALCAAVAIAGLSFAVYASMPEKFLGHAAAGRYAGLTASSAANAIVTSEPAHIGSLQDQSA